jgi:hypothetical protein
LLWEPPVSCSGSRCVIVITFHSTVSWKLLWVCCKTINNNVAIAHIDIQSTTSYLFACHRLRHYFCVP